MLPPRAGILTVPDRAVGKSMMYDAPSQVCITFSSCSGWSKAKRVMWAKIPDDGSVNVYEDDNCSGRIVNSSEKGNFSSSKELARHGKEGDTVRSLLVMETSRYPTNGMVHMCESAQLTNNSTDEKTNELTSASSWNSSDGNLSINWFAALPNASVTE